MGFLTSEVAGDGRFIHTLNRVFPCQILYNRLISVSSNVYFRNPCEKNYESTNFYIIWVNVSLMTQLLRKN